MIRDNTLCFLCSSAGDEEKSFCKTWHHVVKFLHGFEGVGLARDGRVGQVLQLELENKGCIQEEYWNSRVYQQ